MVIRRLRSAGGVTLLLALLAGGLLASGGRPAYAAGSCTASDVNAAPGGNVDVSIDTNGGCNDANGTATNPTTGYVQVTFPSGVSDGYALFATEDNIQGGSHPYDTGSYSLNFTSCTGGSAVPDPINNFQVTNPNGNQFPTPPADGTGTTYSFSNAPFHFLANTAGGTVTCAYSLAVPGTPDLDIGIASYTVDAFIFFTPQTQARTQSVKPPGSCTTCGGGLPTPTPELGSGDLLTLGIVPILGIYLYRRRRRTIR